MIVRSFNRLPALLELLGVLLAQVHDSFEIVVVEQSTERPARPPPSSPSSRATRACACCSSRRSAVRARATPACARLAASCSCSSTTTICRSAPTGYAVTRATLRDPNCLGVTGQFNEPSAAPYVNIERARRDVLSFNVLMWQRVFARTDQKKRVQSLMGGNAAIPRRTLERFGLWDECTPIEDEPSLAFRINAGKARGRISAVRSRREDDPPARRAGRHGQAHDVGPRYAQRVFTYLHNIIGHYFPLRFALLYPLYIYMASTTSTQWICSDSQQAPDAVPADRRRRRFFLVLSPLWTFWLASWAVAASIVGEPPHRPTLHPEPVVVVASSDAVDSDAIASPA